jgi:AcrR family transcriptional regulator
MKAAQEKDAGNRGKADHAMRVRIVAAAHERFRTSGYASTSVAEIAGDLEVAPTYLYKFYASKTAIGVAVCSEVLGSIGSAIWAVARGPQRPVDKIRLLFSVLLKESVGMFFAERKLHDLVARSLEEDWPSIDAHQRTIRDVIGHILAEGMSDGVFDPQLDRDETIGALYWAVFPFAHPRILEQSIGSDLDARAKMMASFCLRAIRPNLEVMVTD